MLIPLHTLLQVLKVTKKVRHRLLPYPVRVVIALLSLLFELNWRIGNENRLIGLSAEIARGQLLLLGHKDQTILRDLRKDIAS